MSDPEYLKRLSVELTDKGKLIEAGWIGLRLALKLEDAPKVQLEEMKKAFFAGAQHLFSSIMTILDEDKEPTDADMKRMSLISDELETFGEQFKEELWGKPH
jgi:hypothetical protein